MENNKKLRKQQNHTRSHHHQHNSLAAMHRDSHTISKSKPKIRIIHIFAPEIIKTDAENFRELVQKLTGKPSGETKCCKKKKKKTKEAAAAAAREEEESRSKSSNGSGLSDSLGSVVKEERSGGACGQWRIFIRTGGGHGPSKSKIISFIKS